MEAKTIHFVIISLAFLMALAEAVSLSEDSISTKSASRGSLHRVPVDDASPSSAAPGGKMLRRNLFIGVVVFGLVFSLAYTSWTSDLRNAVGSWPPDTAKYARPAIPDDLMLSRRAKDWLSG